MKKYFESARQKYKPKIIKFLFIAEAPPEVKSKRFFYFEDVQNGDSLFLETVKVLYPENSSSAKAVRRQKRKFLKRFKNDGFYLIDASDTPIEDPRPSKRREQIKRSLPFLIKKVRSIASKNTKIILISKTVYEIAAHVLKSEGLKVVNKRMIDFPGQGRQVKFRKKLSALLQEHDWRTKSRQRFE